MSQPTAINISDLLVDMNRHAFRDWLREWLVAQEPTTMFRLTAADCLKLLDSLP